MSHELTPLAAAEAAAVEARQDTQTLEVIRLLMEQQTAQIQRDTEQAKAMSAALALAQQQPRKGASDRAWLVLAALGGGAVLVCLFLALSVAAVAVAVTAPVAVKAVRELRKDSQVSQHIDPQVIRRTNTVLSAGTWFLIVGVVAYSLMTTTPLVAAHSAPGWEKSGFLLGLMVDAAFVMALQADSVLARYGVSEPGPWPRRFRFFTGGASVFLNIWHAVEIRDWVGVAVHLIAPALLLIVAEVGPVYRRAMAEALAHAEQTAPVSTGQLAPSTPAPAEDAEQDAPQVEPVDTPAPEVDTPKTERLSTEDARRVIEQGWRDGLSTRETAELSTRTHQWVAREYNRLEAEHGPQPVPGQLQLINAG